MVNDSRSQGVRKRTGGRSDWKHEQLVNGAHAEEAFSTLALLTFPAGKFFVAGGCLVHYSGIPGLCPLTVQLVTTGNVSRYCLMSP